MNREVKLLGVSTTSDKITIKMLKYIEKKGHALKIACATNLTFH